MNDPYSVLEVSRDATEADIKKAFRKLAMKYHPDRNAGDDTAEAKFKEVNEANSILSDPDKRAKFDRHGRDGLNGGSHREHTTAAGWDFAFNGSFEEIMREMSRRQQDFQNQNRSFNTACVIDFMDAFHGREVQLKMPDGREIRLKIPAGVDNGTRIRVQGAGANDHADKPPGDLFVTIQVNPHPDFMRNGKNLFKEVEISALDAMIGTKHKMHALNGQEIEITVPPGIQTDDKLRVEGFGMPLVNTNVVGDLILNMRVRVPTNLSEKQLELLREVKGLSD